MFEPDLEKFKFPDWMIAARTKGGFPDLILRMNSDQNFTGGELIEIKTARTYSISSFNSTLPTATKPVAELTQKTRNDLMAQGEELDELPIREVFYFIRGVNTNAVPDPLYKVCLVHGSFFESIPRKTLIQSALEQMVEELGYQIEGRSTIDPDVIQKIIAKSRYVQDASSKIRFRVMGEAHPDANLLNSKRYPDITDNSLSLILPLDESAGEVPKDDYTSFDNPSQFVSGQSWFQQAKAVLDDAESEVVDATKVGILHSRIKGSYLHLRVDQSRAS